MARASGLGLVSGRSDPLRGDHARDRRADRAARSAPARARSSSASVAARRPTAGSPRSRRSGWSFGRHPGDGGVRRHDPRSSTRRRCSAPQKGATEAQVALLTRRLALLADQYRGAHRRRRHDELEGAGAAGGLAGGLAAHRRRARAGLRRGRRRRGSRRRPRGRRARGDRRGPARPHAASRARWWAASLELGDRRGRAARRGDRRTGHRRRPRGARASVARRSWSSPSPTGCGRRARLSPGPPLLVEEAAVEVGPSRARGGRDARVPSARAPNVAGTAGDRERIGGRSGSSTAHQLRVSTPSAKRTSSAQVAGRTGRRPAGAR